MLDTCQRSAWETIGLYGVVSVLREKMWSLEALTLATRMKWRLVVPMGVGVENIPTARQADAVLCNAHNDNRSNRSRRSEERMSSVNPG